MQHTQAEIEQALETVMKSLVLDREVDGRVIADVQALPGVIRYGATEEEAIAAVRELAREVVTAIAER